MSIIYVPRSPFLDAAGQVSREWLQWLQNPQVLTIKVNSGVSSTSLASTDVTAGIYGTGGRIVSFTVNSAGQLTAASDTAIAINSSQVSGLGSMATQSAGAVTITGGSVAASNGFGANGKSAQTAVSSGSAAPMGGAGTAAGGWDTAAHRDAAIVLLNNIQAALIANGILT